MNPRWWEKPTCFLCDYWYGVLFGIILLIVALMTQDAWLPLITGQIDSGPGQIPTLVPTRTVQATPTVQGTTPATSPSETALPVEETAPAEMRDWLEFHDVKLQYSIQYPSEWFAIPQDGKAADVQDSVLFSDAPGNSNPQTRTGDERARVWIASYQRDGAEQTQWIIQHFNWISGELTPATMDGLSAQVATFAQADQPTWMNQMTWIDRGETTLLVWAQYKKSDQEAQALASHILETLDFASQ